MYNIHAFLKIKTSAFKLAKTLNFQAFLSNSLAKLKKQQQKNQKNQPANQTNKNSTKKPNQTIGVLSRKGNISVSVFATFQSKSDSTNRFKG